MAFFDKFRKAKHGINTAITERQIREDEKRKDELHRLKIKAEEEERRAALKAELAQTKGRIKKARGKGILETIGEHVELRDARPSPFAVPSPAKKPRKKKARRRKKRVAK